MILQILQLSFRTMDIFTSLKTDNLHKHRDKFSIAFDHRK